MVTDPLAHFWMHEAVVSRWVATGRGAYDDDADYGYPTVEACFIEDGLSVVAGSDGQQVISTARVAFPPGTTPIPLGSRITLDPLFGSRVTVVQTVATADAGPQAPNHVVVAVK